MPYLLNILYLTILAAASPWILYRALRQRRYRRGMSQKLWGLVPRLPGTERSVWLHAVSVGEVNLIAPIVRELQTRYPRTPLVVSASTDAGYEVALKKYPSSHVIFAPLDFSWAVRTALRRLRPRMLILAELELWPNLIRGTKRFGAAVVVVNGRLSERSFRGYSRVRFFVRPLLAGLDRILCQTEEYAARFLALGAAGDKVIVTGSIKYDGAQTNRDNERTAALSTLAGLKQGERVFLAGSTQAPEEEIVLDVFRDLAKEYPTLRLILVPRHPHRFEEVAQLLEKSGISWTRRTKLAPGDVADHSRSASSWRILLVDTIGELGAWWGRADVAFVGGSLGSRGGQNMIEPAAYGAAVCFGPNTRNFRDIVAALLARNAACMVHSGEELRQFVRRCLNEPAFAQTLGENARALVKSQLGATARTVEHLAALLPADGSPHTEATNTEALKSEPGHPASPPHVSTRSSTNTRVGG